jgi:carbamoyl-phosphate synthase large subunit
MPKRTDISTILIIGAGPIVIGQACEFDYSGTQACKALKAEGYRIVLVNSNPATIMTDPGLATPPISSRSRRKWSAKIIAHRAPRKLVLLPTMGGQTALNTALTLNARRTGQVGRGDDRRARRGHRQGRGSRPVPHRDDQDRPVPRSRFRQHLRAQAALRVRYEDGLAPPSSRADAADKFKAEWSEHRVLRREEHRLTAQLQAQEAFKIGLPAIIRPSFTLGGTGGGIAYNREEFFDIVERRSMPRPPPKC